MANKKSTNHCHSLFKATNDTHKNPPMGSAVWCHMTKEKLFLKVYMHQTTSPPPELLDKNHKTGTSVCSARPFVSFSPTLKNKKNQNVKKESLQPKKSKKEKNRWEKKKAPEKLYQKSGCLGFFFLEKGTGRGKHIEMRI